MKVIIAGSRGIGSLEVVAKAMSDTNLRISEVVSGTARGVDRLGERWAQERDIPVKRFPADWNRYGRRAGYLRNQEMAEYADVLVVVWDGESRGTKHMIDIMRQAGKIVHIISTREGSTNGRS